MRKYGHIFRLDWGNFPTVWLCKFDDLAEAFKKDILSDRPHFLMPAMVSFEWFFSPIYYFTTSQRMVPSAPPVLLLLQQLLLMLVPPLQFSV